MFFCQYVLTVLSTTHSKPQSCEEVALWLTVCVVQKSRAHPL